MSDAGKRYRDTVPTHDEMEELFVNNETFDRIAAYLNRFNPIHTMRMAHMEIRHSAILTWLLDPAETHGFGDRFLKAFLSEALRGQSSRGTPTALDIAQSDLRDAEIRREWQNIDILIVSRQNRWVFIVENKFYANQHQDQLSSYLSKVRAAFEPQGSDLTVRGIFLTLFDEEPHDPGFVPIRYAAICELLPRLMALEGINLGAEVATFLGHYLEVINEEAGMSEEHDEMIELARQLYRLHRKALDFVMENGASTDFVVAAKSTFQGEWEHLRTIRSGTGSYLYNHHDNWKFSFMPSSWAAGFGGEAYDWPGCESWWAGYPMICWLQLFENDAGSSGALKLFAEVGPLADHEFRSSLIAAIKGASDDHPDRIRFQQGSDRLGKRFSKFLKQNQIDIGDTRDADEIARGMRLLLERFQPSFETIARVLPQFQKYGQP